ncbi:MAG: PhzF family phenazine biosynthesis isomerase [Vicinamibacterales bacterium]
MPSEYRFAIVDVFTDQPFNGNPLTVVPDAGNLGAETMQAIAQEFGFSETTFVVAPRPPRAARRLRCFSPVAEVFGAGHTALGCLVAARGRCHITVPSDGMVTQERRARKRRGAHSDLRR